MSQYVLNDNNSENYQKLDDFTRGYIEAMFFTNGDISDEDEYLLDKLGTEKLSNKAILDIIEDCRQFQVLASKLLEIGYKNGYDENRAGNDFWFTRQGHGTGFWDRPELEIYEINKKISKIAKSFGRAYVEVNNGWINHY